MNTIIILGGGVFFSHSKAYAVAKNIVRKIKSEKADGKFCTTGYCMLEAGEDMAGLVVKPVRYKKGKL